MLVTKKIGASFVAIVAVCASLPASADDKAGTYARIFGGLSQLSDTDLSGSSSASIGFDTGQVIGAAVGYDFGAQPFRTELEFAYRTSDADGSSGIKGDLASTTLALNGYYDFSPIGNSKVTPYVGAGLAYVTEIDFDVAGGTASGEYNDTGVFAYQLMVGAMYPINDKWSLTSELRYFDAGSQSLGGPGGSTLRSDYDLVEVTVGAAFRF